MTYLGYLFVGAIGVGVVGYVAGLMFFSGLPF
jgi:hypothetical protein